MSLGWGPGGSPPKGTPATRAPPQDALEERCREAERSNRTFDAKYRALKDKFAAAQEAERALREAVAQSGQFEAEVKRAYDAACAERDAAR